MSVHYRSVSRHGMENRPLLHDVTCYTRYRFYYIIVYPPFPPHDDPVMTPASRRVGDCVIVVVIHSLNYPLNGGHKPGRTPGLGRIMFTQLNWWSSCYVFRSMSCRIADISVLKTDISPNRHEPTWGWGFPTHVTSCHVIPKSMSASTDMKKWHDMQKNVPWNRHEQI